jgi:hypothetical protein
MVSYRIVCIIRIMLFWNYIRDFSYSIYNRCYKFYNYLKDYFYGQHDIWLFISDHTLPLSMNNLYNLVNVSWTYDNFNTSLTLGDSTNNLTKYKFAWLSSNIRVYNTEDNMCEYNIDDFLDIFSLTTTEDIVPSLYIFFMCWCVHTKHWFKSDNIIEFYIIDDMGEEIILNINDHNNSLIIKNNKIVVIDSNEKNNTINHQDNEIITALTDEILILQESKSKED